MYRYALLAAAAVPMVAGHGFVTSPAARRPGAAYGQACGAQALNQQSADINGNVQGIMQVIDSSRLDPSLCNLWLCKGFQLEDNPENVQSYTLGQTIDFEVDIAAPHTGVANVSVVRTSTNSIIGAPLIEFENYASTATGVDPSNRAFSVTLPEDLEGQCTTAGDCVLQWYWDAPDIDQTYESCVDFTVAGSGSGSPAPAPSASATATPTTSVAVPEPTATSPVEEPAETPIEDDDEEDDECPAEDDDDEDEEPVEDDDECPAEDDEEDEEPVEDDDECPADEEDDDYEGVEEDDEDECPADDEDEEPVEDDDECPADDDEDEEPVEDDDECPADDEEDEEDDETLPGAPAPTFVTVSQSMTGVNVRPTTFATVIREVTVTAPPATVTVTATAEGSECTTA